MNFFSVINKGRSFLWNNIQILWACKSLGLKNYIGFLCLNSHIGYSNLLHYLYYPRPMRIMVTPSTATEQQLQLGSFTVHRICGYHRLSNISCNFLSPVNTSCGSTDYPSMPFPSGHKFVFYPPNLTDQAPLAQSQANMTKNKVHCLQTFSTPYYSRPNFYGRP